MRVFDKTTQRYITVNKQLPKVEINTEPNKAVEVSKTAEHCATYIHVKELMKEYLTHAQMAAKIGTTRSNITYHVNKIRENGDTDRVKVKLNK